jgi:hypothetical protein
LERFKKNQSESEKRGKCKPPSRTCSQVVSSGNSPVTILMRFSSDIALYVFLGMYNQVILKRILVVAREKRAPRHEYIQN